MLDLRLNKEAMTEESSLYDTKEQKLRAELAQAKQQRQGSEAPSDWLEEAKSGFQLLPEIVDTLQDDDLREKQEALTRLGSNLTLTDGKVSICNAKWVREFIDALEEARRKNPPFEPKNIVDTTDENKVFVSVRPILRRGIYNVRTCLMNGI